jgi:GNAT superfamily N-acetyltransferase
MRYYRELSGEGHALLSATLGDLPEYVTPNHLLLRGYCKAYIAGSPTEFRGAVVDSQFEPGEPYCFGSDVEILWGLLQNIPQLDCFQADIPVAERLGALFLERNGWNPLYVGQIVQTLSSPVKVFPDIRVRLLTLKDAPSLRSAQGELGGIGFQTPEQMLSEGFAACAILDGEVVSSAFTSAITERYVDVRIRTAEEYRGKGLATAAASLIAQQVQRMGKTPVWLTYENNHASLAVSRKLGFREVTRKTDVFFRADQTDT